MYWEKEEQVCICWIWSFVSYKDSIYWDNMLQVRFKIICISSGDSVFFLSVPEYLLILLLSLNCIKGCWQWSRILYRRLGPYLPPILIKDRHKHNCHTNHEHGSTFTLSTYCCFMDNVGRGLILNLVAWIPVDWFGRFSHLIFLQVLDVLRSPLVITVYDLRPWLNDITLHYKHSYFCLIQQMYYHLATNKACFTKHFSPFWSAKMIKNIL